MPREPRLLQVLGDVIGRSAHKQQVKIVTLALKDVAFQEKENFYRPLVILLTSFYLLHIKEKERKMTPTYTFMSKSTAKEGKLDDLIRIACEPPKAIAKNLGKPVTYQVSVDRERNTVVVWVSLPDKESLYTYLETAQGQDDHSTQEDQNDIIDTFEMYDLTPQIQNVVLSATM